MADDPLEATKEAQKAAREYAWNWFSYHAGQRQSVFRFYLILIGAGTTLYVTTSSSDSGAAEWAYVFGLIIFVLSFLFWQLDERSRTLVNVAQDYLKVDEHILSKAIGTDAIELARRSDEQRCGVLGFHSLSSFKRVYRVVFLLVGLLGAVIFFLGIGSPFRQLFCGA